MTQTKKIEYGIQILYNAVSMTFTTWLYFSAEKNSLKPLFIIEEIKYTFETVQKEITQLTFMN
jgi:hypothetical protein